MKRGEAEATPLRERSGATGRGFSLAPFCPNLTVWVVSGRS